MEAPLNYNWNVYKLFKNGKRAKAPFHVFEYDDPMGVSDHYEKEIKENFTKKLRDSKIMILRCDLPQSRKAEEGLESEKNLQKRKNRVFAKHLKKIDGRALKNCQVIGGLIFCKETDWQWQWAALESGTSRYLAGFSPAFPTARGADAWMELEISKL
tara:strand:+ start:1525 stop:1995 length:471 start_codon:yes stop_codon:yes gene_type:complete